MRLSALFFVVYQAFAQGAPQPPCGMDPIPAYPSVDAPPVVKFWKQAELERDWKPPACTGWTTTGYSTLTTVSARFHYSGSSDDLLRRIGAISQSNNIRYWSTTHKQWQTLISDSFAVNSFPSAQRRPDFTPEEIKPGETVYFQQSDNISGKAVFRMHVGEASSDRIVYEVENVSPMHYYLLTTFHSGDLQTVYFLDRESENVWRFYSMVRTGKNSSRITADHENSSMNRAVAFYRHLAGIPTDREPPAAR
jgi:hypothetical protein